MDIIFNLVMMIVSVSALDIGLYCFILLIEWKGVARLGFILFKRKKKFYFTYMCATGEKSNFCASHEHMNELE